MNPQRFINDIVKPWDELNSLLCENFALQPDLSDITRLAGGIAVSIRHQVDFSTLNDRQANEICAAHRIISDAGDYWKHGSLRKKERNSPITVSAAFEFSEPLGFRFIRNMIFVEHKSLGAHDFMEVSATAIKFWINQHNININWQGAVLESRYAFEPTARLGFNQKYCISMSNVQLRFLQKDSNGAYTPVDPPEVKFEVYEYS